MNRNQVKNIFYFYLIAVRIWEHVEIISSTEVKTEHFENLPFEIAPDQVQGERTTVSRPRAVQNGESFPRDLLQDESIFQKYDYLRGLELAHSSDETIDSPIQNNTLPRAKRSPTRTRRQKRMKRFHKEFAKYEKCMNKRKKMSKKFGDGFTKAKILMEGQTVKLSCMVCLRPDQNVEDYDISWRRRVMSSSKEKNINIDHEHFVVMPDKTLQINKVTLEDGGLYYCYHGNGHAASYMLDVLRGERYETVFKPPDKGRRPAKAKKLRKYNIKLQTHWGSWSRCNQCNKRGQYRRIGFCTVKKLDKDKPLKPHDSLWLSQFEEGLPCRSSLLPASVTNRAEVRKRSSEILMAYCFIPCPTLPALKTFTDADGNVIEVVKANKGFVSMREEVPKLPKMVKRKIIYEKKGRRIKLDCPHGREGETSVRWQNGSQTMNALTIRRETRGRVIIDPLQSLRIRRLKLYDTASYSCWVDGQHIATIKIRVVTKMRRSYKDYILLGGFVAVILILCCVGGAVCVAQRKKTLR